MNKKVLIMLVSGLVVILIIILVSMFLLQPEKETPYYSDNPSDWISSKAAGVKEISIDKATKGEGYIDDNGQQYDAIDIGTVFTYEGWYKGVRFRRELSDEDGNMIMRINQEMNPRDGVIEGFIIERIEEGKIYAYIFLDDDWKESVENTIIYWGKHYQLDKDFDFLPIRDNIYSCSR